MIKTLFMLLISYSLFAGEVFLVTFKGAKALVEPQSKKGQFVSLTIKNDTFKLLRGEIRNEENVIKYYSLKPGTSESYEIGHKEYKKLSLINVAPAFDTIPLKFGSEAYAIPK